MLIRICDICGEETGKEYYNVAIDAAARCFDKMHKTCIKFIILKSTLKVTFSTSKYRIKMPC